MFKRYRLRDYDFKLVLLILALSAVGVIAVGSAEPSLQNKQLAGVVAGVVLMVVVSLFDYTMVIRLNWLMYVANLVLLVAVWQLGDETKGNTAYCDCISTQCR